MLANENNAEFAERLIKSTWEFRMIDTLHSSDFNQNPPFELASIDYLSFLDIICSKEVKKLSSEELERGRKIATLCNYIRTHEPGKALFGFIKELDSMIQSTEYFLNSVSFADVFVLSALSRCIIWPRLRKKHKENLDSLPNLLPWYAKMYATYNHLIDYRIDPSIQTKKHLKATLQDRLKRSQNTQIIKAVRESNIAEVSHLLEIGVDIDTLDPKDSNKTSCHIAAELGDMEMLKFLISRKCNIEAQDIAGLTPLFYAIKADNLEVVQFLISAGANKEHKEIVGRTPIYTAAFGSSLKMVKFLSDLGCDINAASKLNRTALSKACYAGRTEMVEFLLSLPNIKIDLRDTKGRSALHNAVWGAEGGREGKRVGTGWGTDSPECARLLLAHKADINLKDIFGNTPLCIASSTKALSSIPVLMEFGAEIEARNEDKETPLYLACSHEHLEVVQLLIEKYGADYWAECKRGWNCLEVNLSWGHLKIFKYLMGLPKVGLRLKELEEKQQDNAKGYSSLIDFIFEHRKESDFIEYYEIVSQLVSQHGVKISPKLSSFQKIAAYKSSRVLTDILKNSDLKRYDNSAIKKTVSIFLEEDWLEGLEILMKLGEGLYDLATEIEPADLMTLEQTSSKTFTFLLRNYQFNPLKKCKKDIKFICDLAFTRKTDLLSVCLRHLFSEKERQGIQNKKLMSLSYDDAKAALNDTESDGYNCFDHVTILGFMDIRSILQTYCGSLDYHCKIPEYTLEHVADIQGSSHAEAHRLENLADKLVSEFINSSDVKQFVDSYLNIYEETKQEYLTFASQANQTNASNTNTFEELLKSKEMIFVSEIENLSQIQAYLLEQRIIGVDLEYHKESLQGSKVGFICLLQISSLKVDYVFDAFKLGENLAKMIAPIFSSWKILKLFHGSDTDLKWLKSCLGLDLVNIYDTSRAEMHINKFKTAPSLLNLAKQYLGFELDKSYQISDWRVRPLPSAMLEYARKDASTLLLLFVKQNEIIINQSDLFKVVLEDMIRVCYKRIEKLDIQRVNVHVSN